MTLSATDLGPLEGDLVLPGSPAYEPARKPAMARFDDVRPQAIVRCASARDVAAALSFARRRGLATATRSGGHCFAGRSSTAGILIDVSPMRSVSVADGVVIVGAGTPLGDVYDALEPHGQTLAAGCGPTVGIAGLTLGGGLGILGRKHGLTSDQLVAAEVVLADGRVVECDDHRHEDLFWALRGAGGCQFGVVTELAFRTVPAPTTTTLHLVWPQAHAAALLDAWQSWAPHAPDELAASLLLIAAPEVDQPILAHLFGAMLGTEAEATTLVDDLVVRAGAQPVSASLLEMPYRDAKRHLADHGPGELPPPPGHSYAKSDFFRQPLPADAAIGLVEHLAENRIPGQARGLDLSPWGGAYNRIPSDATAFPHRAEQFLLKHDVVIGADAATAEREAAHDWLAGSWAIVRPWASGGVYPNFPDPELEDWASAYHGDNYARLETAKRTYDPEGVFRFDQSLP